MLEEVECSMQTVRKIDHYGQLYGMMSIATMAAHVAGNNIEEWKAEEFGQWQVEFHRLYDTLTRHDAGVLLQGEWIETDSVMPEFQQEKKELELRDPRIDLKAVEQIKEKYLQGILDISIQKVICAIRPGLKKIILSQNPVLPEDTHLDANKYTIAIDGIQDDFKRFKIDEGDCDHILVSLRSLLRVRKPTDNDGIKVSFKTPEELRNILHDDKIFQKNYQLINFKTRICSILSHLNVIALPSLTQLEMNKHDPTAGLQRDFGEDISTASRPRIHPEVTPPNKRNVSRKERPSVKPPKPHKFTNDIRPGNSGLTRKERVPWTEEETEAVREGYKKFAENKFVWKDIKEFYHVILENRSNVQIKVCR